VKGRGVEIDFGTGGSIDNYPQSDWYAADEGGRSAMSRRLRGASTSAISG
jgi:hypothetical protein